MGKPKGEETIFSKTVSSWSLSTFLVQKLYAFISKER